MQVNVKLNKGGQRVGYAFCMDDRAFVRCLCARDAGGPADDFITLAAASTDQRLSRSRLPAAWAACGGNAVMNLPLAPQP
jgi:hypothetical protein